MSASDPGSPAPTSGRARRRWLVPLLVASLGFNLVVIGTALSGWVWPHDRDHRGMHRSTDLLPRSFFRELDRERRNELTEVFRARRMDFREQRQALREAAAEFADAVEREPYDAQSVQSAITEHAERGRQLVDLGATVAGELVETLTPEERQTLARIIRQRLEEDRERRDRRERRSR